MHPERGFPVRFGFLGGSSNSLIAIESLDKQMARLRVLGIGNCEAWFTVSVWKLLAHEIHGPIHSSLRADPIDEENLLDLCWGELTCGDGVGKQIDQLWDFAGIKPGRFFETVRGVHFGEEFLNCCLVA